MRASRGFGPERTKPEGMVETKVAPQLIEALARCQMGTLKYYYRLNLLEEANQSAHAGQLSGTPWRSPDRSARPKTLMESLKQSPRPN